MFSLEKVSIVKYFRKLHCIKISKAINGSLPFLLLKSKNKVKTENLETFTKNLLIFCKLFLKFLFRAKMYAWRMRSLKEGIILLLVLVEKKSDFLIKLFYDEFETKTRKKSGLGNIHLIFYDIYYLLLLWENGRTKGFGLGELMPTFSKFLVVFLSLKKI